MNLNTYWMLSYVLMPPSTPFHSPFQLALPPSIVDRTLAMNLGSVTVTLRKGFCSFPLKP